VAFDLSFELQLAAKDGKLAMKQQIAEKSPNQVRADLHLPSLADPTANSQPDRGLRSARFSHRTKPSYGRLYFSQEQIDRMALGPKIPLSIVQQPRCPKEA
jgi:hypothetical protein